MWIDPRILDVPSPSDFSGHRIAIASADGRGSRRTLVRADGAIWFPTMSPDGTRIAYAEGGFHPRGRRLDG
jgi:Tol biopolymer transport system component